MGSLEPLERVASILRRLPGVGRKSAERMAYALALNPGGLVRELRAALGEAESALAICQRCSNLTIKTEDPCKLCTDPRREDRLLCVVQDPADVDTIEKAGVFRGRYHILRGPLSPAQGSGVAETGIDGLLARIPRERVEEVLLAFNADVESDATAAFLRDAMGRLGVRITRLARGIPSGSGLVYTDAATLAQAIQDRKTL
jgi:recombination protein RecR